MFNYISFICFMKLFYRLLQHAKSCLFASMIINTRHMNVSVSCVSDVGVLISLGVVSFWNTMITKDNLWGTLARSENTLQRQYPIYHSCTNEKQKKYVPILSLFCLWPIFCDNVCCCLFFECTTTKQCMRVISKAISFSSGVRAFLFSSLLPKQMWGKICILVKLKTTLRNQYASSLRERGFDRSLNEGGIVGPFIVSDCVPSKKVWSALCFTL